MMETTKFFLLAVFIFCLVSSATGVSLEDVEGGKNIINPGQTERYVFKLSNNEGSTPVFLDITVNSSRGMSKRGSEFRIRSSISGTESDCGFMSGNNNSVVYRCASGTEIEEDSTSMRAGLIPSVMISPGSYHVKFDLKRFKELPLETDETIDENKSSILRIKDVTVKITADNDTFVLLKDITDSYSSPAGFNKFRTVNLSSENGFKNASFVFRKPSGEDYSVFRKFSDSDEAYWEKMEAEKSEGEVRFVSQKTGIFGLFRKKSSDDGSQGSGSGGGGGGGMASGGFPSPLDEEENTSSEPAPDSEPEKCDEPGEWICNSYGGCSDGERTRECRFVECNTTVRRSEESKDCEKEGRNVSQTSDINRSKTGTGFSEVFTGYQAIFRGNFLAVLISLTGTAGLYLYIKKKD